MPVEGRGLSSRAALEGEQDMGDWREPISPGKSSETPDGVTCESEGGLRDSGSIHCATKVWRADVLAAAWQAVRRNGGGRRSRWRDGGGHRDVRGGAGGLESWRGT